MVCPKGQRGWDSADILQTRGRGRFWNFYAGVFYGHPLTQSAGRPRFLEPEIVSNFPQSERVQLHEV